MPAKIKINKRHMFIFGPLVLLVVATAIGFAIWHWPAVKVGKYSYNRHDYELLVSEAIAQGEDRPGAHRAIVEALAARAAADELKLPYASDQSSIDDATRAFYGLGNVEPSEYSRLKVYPKLVEPALKVTEQGGYRVAIINFPFSRYLAGFIGDRQGDPKLIGSKEAINDDKHHAEALLKQYQSEYAAGSKSLEQIVAEVHKDPRLVYGQTTNQSRIAFVTNNATEENISGTDLLEAWRFARIQEQAKRLGEVKVYEDTYDADVKTDYGVDMPELKRGDTKTLVGWYMLVVEQKIDRQADIKGRYEQLVKEYAGEKN